MRGTKKNEKTFFRSILGNAITHTWHHRELWPIAAIAGLVGIGAGINNILTQARLSSSLPTINEMGGLEGIALINELTAGITLQGPYAIAITTAIFIILAVTGAVLVAWCQHIILRASNHAIAKNAPLGINELAKDAAHPRIFRILTVDALVKILTLNIVMISGILITALNPQHHFFDALFGTIFSTTALCIAFAINIWGMLALIQVIKKNATVVRALEASWLLIKKHPIPCIELSLMLFATTLAVSVIAIAGLIFIGSVSVPLFSVVISQGTLAGITTITFLTVLFGTTWAVAAAGFSTLITYLSWSNLEEILHAQKKTTDSRTKVHIKKTVKHLFT